MPTVHIVPLRTRNPDGSTSTQHPTTATTQPFTTSLACCGAPSLSAGLWRACLGGDIGLELLCPSQAISAVPELSHIPEPLCPSRRAAPAEPSHILQHCA